MLPSDDVVNSAPVESGGANTSSTIGVFSATRFAMFDDARKRWWALYVLCSGVLMIVLDTTIVNVALPSIREDLNFTETSLVWVVNAYMLTFGGFLLLGGRLGDLFGHRRLFLLGPRPVHRGFARLRPGHSQGMLIAARAIQGSAARSSRRSRCH